MCSLHRCCGANLRSLSLQTPFVYGLFVCMQTNLSILYLYRLMTSCGDVNQSASMQTVWMRTINTADFATVDLHRHTLKLYHLETIQILLDFFFNLGKRQLNFFKMTSRGDVNQSTSMQTVWMRTISTADFATVDLHRHTLKLNHLETIQIFIGFFFSLGKRQLNFFLIFATQCLNSDSVVVLSCLFYLPELDITNKFYLLVIYTFCDKLERFCREDLRDCPSTCNPG